MNVVCFDLEGPLSPQDNAYELMGLFKNGYEVFEVLSKYDDILALEGRKDYEPGDTLSLIIPFLLYNNVKEDDIRRVSEEAGLVPQVDEVVNELKDSWNVYVISTSYQQHAFNIAKQAGIDEWNVYSTKLELDKYYSKVEKKDLEWIGDVQDFILDSVAKSGDEEIKKYLDEFYSSISENSLSVTREVKVVGGQRKLDALNTILGNEGKKLSEVAVVGDSITDFKMLDAVRKAGGLSVVFNGNKYALPYGNFGLACSSMKPLLKVMNSYADAGLERVKELAVDFKMEGYEYGPYLNSLESLSEEESKGLVEIHSKARKLVRGAASKLG